MAWINGKSGTYNISTNNSAISGYVYWSERYDIANNKSEVSQTAYLHRTNIYDGNTWFENGTVTRIAFFGSETVPTTVVTSMTLKGNTSANGGEYLQVYSAVKEIPHNADGSKSLTLGFSMSNNVGGVAGNSFTVPKTTATVSLTTIPRATTPSLTASSVTMGQTIRITLTPADSTFKHKIRYEFGSLVSQVAGLTSGVDFTSLGTTYHDFTPPASLANQIPSANSGTAKLIVYTYKNDGTHIGTKTVDITINVPNYTPTIGGVALTGNNLLNGVYVAGKSTVKVTTAAVSSYGASIKSYTTVVDGKTYEGHQFTTSALTAGYKTAVVIVTDTRGKTAQMTSEEFAVYAYSPPAITEVTLARTGTDNKDVKISVKGVISPVNGENTKNTKITFSLPGKTPIEINASQLSSVENGQIATGTIFTNVPTDNTLIATITITDSYSPVTREVIVPTVAVTMDFHSSGKGIALGKVAEAEDLLDVAWNERVRKDLQVDGNINGVKIGSDNYVHGGSRDVTSENWIADAPTFIGTYNHDNQWFSTISLRHRNGLSDGKSYGLQIRNWLTQEDAMSWRQQINGSWTAWQKILDTSNCPDYVIERGTYDGWEYTKWNSGKMELFGEKSLSFPEGTKQGDFPLYRSIVSLNLSGLLTKIMSGTCCIQTNGMVPQVCRHSSNLSTAEIVIVTSRTFSAFTITAPVYIIGKWK